MSKLLFVGGLVVTLVVLLTKAFLEFVGKLRVGIGTEWVAPRKALTVGEDAHDKSRVRSLLAGLRVLAVVLSIVFGFVFLGMRSVVGGAASLLVFLLTAFNWQLVEVAIGWGRPRLAAFLGTAAETQEPWASGLVSALLAGSEEEAAPEWIERSVEKAPVTSGVAVAKGLMSYRSGNAERGRAALLAALEFDALRSSKRLRKVAATYLTSELAQAREFARLARVPYIGDAHDELFLRLYGAMMAGLSDNVERLEEQLTLCSRKRELRALLIEADAASIRRLMRTEASERAPVAARSERPAEEFVGLCQRLGTLPKEERLEADLERLTELLEFADGAVRTRFQKRLGELRSGAPVDDALDALEESFSAALSALDGLAVREAGLSNSIPSEQSVEEDFRRLDAIMNRARAAMESGVPHSSHEALNLFIDLIVIAERIADRNNSYDEVDAYETFIHTGVDYANWIWSEHGEMLLASALHRWMERWSKAVNNDRIVGVCQRNLRAAG